MGAPSEPGSDQVHYLQAEATEQAPALAVDIQKDRVKQMKTGKAVDRQQLQYPTLSQDQGVARTPHGAAAHLSEQERSSNFQRRTESQKMNSEMTPMHQLNLSLLSKKQDDFRHQVLDQRSFVRFRYPNMELNDRDKLETAYGSAAVKAVRPRRPAASTKGSNSRVESHDQSRDAEQTHLAPIHFKQNTQIHAQETSVNSMNG